MNLSLKEVCKLYLEYSIDNLLSMMDQILKSPELISEMNRVSPRDMKKVKKNLRSLANKVLDKEVSYYIKRYKIKDAKDFIDLFYKLPASDLKKNRQRIAREIIKKNLK